jgi:HSP20 family protein
MAITLWKNRGPFEGISSFMGDVDTLFDFDRWFDFGTRRRSMEGVWRPAVDIKEKNGKYILVADLPGVKKEDIHVELHDGYLTLKGERKEEHEEKKKGFYRTERVYGSFERSFRVPEGVTEKDIKAKYHDGVLELNIPAPKVEAKKAIEVKVE